MSQCIFNTTIQFRRDTTANWLANQDVIPAAGEPCVDLDLGTLRIGDGVTKYVDLKVLTANQSGIDSFKVAGILLPVAADNSVDIPMASNDAPGVVIGCQKDNKVYIADDGTMEIYSLSIDRLSQSESESVVIGGGGAAG